MSKNVTVIPMGKYFTLKQLIEKLKELGMDDLYSPGGAPLTYTSSVGYTQVMVEHDGWTDDCAPIIWFEEYDWVENPINVEYSIFDYYTDCAYQPDVYPEYVCVDRKTLATKIVIVYTDTHRYAHVA